eukprot:g4294.t1
MLDGNTKQSNNKLLPTTNPDGDGKGFLRIVLYGSTSRRRESGQIKKREKMICGILRNRSVLKVRGKDSEKFLQGMITNDILGLESDRGLYAAFLTNKSRIIGDTLISVTGEGDYLLDCDRNRSKQLHKQLRMYKLRSEVDIEDVSDRYAVSWTSRDRFRNDAISTYVDPRLSCLGTREIFDTSRDSSNAEDVSAVYDEVRLRNGVAEGSEIASLFPLEVSLDWLNGVNFRKGCYLGQELTARTHFRGVIRKRCIPVVFEGDDLPEASSSPAQGSSVASVDARVIVGAEGRSAGKLLTDAIATPSGEWRGLAMIRLSHLDDYVESSSSKDPWFLEGDEEKREGMSPAPVRVVPAVPDWWKTGENGE